jgi:hypothetical protein
MDFGFNSVYGTNIARNVQIPTLGKEYDLDFSVNVRIPGRITISPEYHYSRLDSLFGNGSFFNGAIYRVTLLYQISREMNIRLITQYNSFATALEVDPLFTYQLNTLTSFYVGSSHNYNSYDNVNILHPSERQFFAKIQYLIQ